MGTGPSAYSHLIAILAQLAGFFFASAMARMPKRSLEEAQATIRGLQAQVEERSLTIRRFELQWISESEKMREEKDELQAKREKLAAAEEARGEQRDGSSCVFLGSLRKIGSHGRIFLGFGRALRSPCSLASSWPTLQCFVAHSLALPCQALAVLSLHVPLHPHGLPVHPAPPCLSLPCVPPCMCRPCMRRHWQARRPRTRLGQRPRRQQSNIKR